MKSLTKKTSKTNNKINLGLFEQNRFQIMFFIYFYLIYLILLY